MSGETVFVSGATGYIAANVVKELLNSGYTVIGSVRTSEKGENLKKWFKSSKFDYEIVKDIKAKGAFDEALEKHPEVSVFLHTASPLPSSATDPEKDVLIPAIEGTKNALSAIHHHGKNIKKVVITSSYASMGGSGFENPSAVNNEESWTPITYDLAKTDPFLAYIGAKTFAEKAAWDFVKKENAHFSLTAVNPVYVFGPHAFDEVVSDTMGSTAEYVFRALKWENDSDIISHQGTFIDVRDVAKAHRKAFELEEAAGKRLLLSAGEYESQKVLDILHKELPNATKNVTKGSPGDYKASQTITKIENEKTKKILGFPFISLEKSAVDTVQQLLDASN